MAERLIAGLIAGLVILPSCHPEILQCHHSE